MYCLPTRGRLHRGRHEFSRRVTSTVATLTVNPAILRFSRGLLDGGAVRIMQWILPGKSRGAVERTAFGVGKVGRAFSFDGVNDRDYLQCHPALNPTNGPHRGSVGLCAQLSRQ